MVLDESKILELIQNPIQAENIAAWREEHIVLDVYLNGGDVATQLEKVKNFENNEQKKLRDKIARSTKDLVSYLLNPLNKVFSANGFVVDIEAPTETEIEQFKDHLEELPEGVSLRDWMQTYWLDAFIADPNSVLLVESETDEQERPKSYPTYKSINVIHDFKLKWDNFLYLILLHKKVLINNEEVQIYRVYDWEKDALYYVEDNELKPYGNREGVQDFEDEHIVHHNKGYVPAVIPSNIIEKKGGKKSFINKIDEILKEYMRDSSVHSIYKFLHGFPKFWSYASKCVRCEGTGLIDNPRYVEGGDQPRQIPCPDCDGTGLKKTSDVSDGVRLPLPTHKDSPTIAPNILGYVSPDLETWSKQVEELQEMKSDMYFTLWGANMQESETIKTATESRINLEPVLDRLDSISSNGERVETKLIQFMGEAMIGENFKGVSKYGRRYALETPDILWANYIEAKEKQAPLATLDYLYERFLRREYHNDETILEKKIKEFKLEPYVHWSINDLKGNSKQIQKKILFSEWIIEQDLDDDYETLKEDLKKYIIENLEDEKSTEVPSEQEQAGVQ